MPRNGAFSNISSRCILVWLESVFHSLLCPHPQTYTDSDNSYFRSTLISSSLSSWSYCTFRNQEERETIEEGMVGIREGSVPGCRKHAPYMQLSVTDGHGIFRLADAAPNNYHEGPWPVQVRQNWFREALDPIGCGLKGPCYTINCWKDGSPALD